MSEYRSQQPVSGWASGGVVFAGVMLVLIGCFQSIAGLTAIFNDDFFASASNYTFDLDPSTWGWIHLADRDPADPLGPVALLGSRVGRCRRDHARGPERGLELLLHPVLPVLEHPRDRTRLLGDLGDHAAGLLRRVGPTHGRLEIYSD